MYSEKKREKVSSPLPASRIVDQIAAAAAAASQKEPIFSSNKFPAFRATKHSTEKEAEAEASPFPL